MEANGKLMNLWTPALSYTPKVDKEAKTTRILLVGKIPRDKANKAKTSQELEPILVVQMD